MVLLIMLSFSWGGLGNLLSDVFHCFCVKLINSIQILSRVTTILSHLCKEKLQNAPDTMALQKGNFYPDKILHKITPFCVNISQFCKLIFNNAPIYTCIAKVASPGRCDPMSCHCGDRCLHPFHTQLWDDVLGEIRGTPPQNNLKF